MLPVTYDLFLERGTKTRYKFTLKETETGEAIDLTGSSFTGQIRRNPSTIPTITLDIEILDPATSGSFQFVIDDADFDTIPESLDFGHYDILWQQADGMKPKLMRGNVTVSPTITQTA